MNAIAKSIIYLPILAIFSCTSSDKNKPADQQQGKADSTQKVSVNSIQKNDSIDPKFTATWAAFVTAVKNGDSKALKELSTDCVLCGECLYNTDAESKAYNQLLDKASDANKKGSKFDMDDSLIAAKGYYPIDKFIKEDFAIVFDSAIKSRIADPKLITITNNEHNRKLFTKDCITKSTELGTPKLLEVNLDAGQGDGEFGWTAVFAFIETKNGYKFCGFSAVGG